MRSGKKGKRRQRGRNGGIKKERRDTDGGRNGK